MRLMRRVRIAAVVTFVIGTFPAFAQPLTRASAEEAINTSPDFRAKTIPGPPDQDHFELALKDAVWQPSVNGGFVPGSSNPEIVYETKKTYVLASIDFTGIGLGRPLRRRIRKISGIADQADASTRIAEFTWVYDDPSSEYLTFITKYTGINGDEHNGQALFRHYDDGWRVVKLVDCTKKDGVPSCPTF
jgi:hypothetical protein